LFTCKYDYVHIKNLYGKLPAYKMIINVSDTAKGMRLIGDQIFDLIQFLVRFNLSLNINLSI
jgi:hypothetical protein